MTNLERYALFLLAADRPFVRWSELSGKEQEAYTRKAHNVSEHLRAFEPRFTEETDAETVLASWLSHAESGILDIGSSGYLIAETKIALSKHKAKKVAQ